MSKRDVADRGVYEIRGEIFFFFFFPKRLVICVPAL